jgi:hypothetical protein
MRPDHEENVMPTYTQMRDLFQKYHDPRDMVAGHLYRSPQEQAHMTFGIVEDNKDPDELGRIKVWMPMLAPDAKAWMPVVKPFTGIWMMPEIEDEVLVGFIANDPLAPVCLGGYYNPRTAPPIQKNPDNNLKVFTSRSGMRVEINDTDGEERITAFALEGKMRLVVTPEGISAVNEEGDVTLSCKTFTVEETEAISIAAEKKMSLECKDPFTLESGGATEIKASGDVKNNGKKIKVKGSTGVTSGGKQLAKKDDQVVGVDLHDIKVPSQSGLITIPAIPHPYIGKLADKLSDDVTINDKPAATKDSKSQHNSPGHICMPPGVMFANSPSGEGVVSSGTASKCKINDKEAACLGSMVKTCNDPQDQETCTIIAVGMAVKLPIMMPGMDPAQFEQDGGTTFNADEPTATQEEKQQADKKNAERAKKQAEEKSKQQKSGGDSKAKDSETLTTKERAEIGEAVAHQMMLQNGYKPLGNTNGQYQQGQTGIDGVYEAPASKQPPKYVVVEAKYGKARLGKTKGPNGEKRKQMQDEWVTDVPPDRLKKAGLDRKQQKEIREGLEDGDGSVGKVVIRTNKKGEPKAKHVNSKGNIVRGKKGLYQL